MPAPSMFVGMANRKEAKTEPINAFDTQPCFLNSSWLRERSKWFEGSANVLFSITLLRNKGLCCKGIEMKPFCTEVLVNSSGIGATVRDPWPTLPLCFKPRVQLSCSSLHLGRTNIASLQAPGSNRCRTCMWKKCRNKAALFKVPHGRRIAHR